MPGVDVRRGSAIHRATSYRCGFIVVTSDCVFQLGHRAAADLPLASRPAQIAHPLYRLIHMWVEYDPPADIQIGRMCVYFTKIKLCLPCQHTWGTAAVATTARCLRVLIVDDEPDTVDTTALLLSLDGHEVETANDGPNAIARAAAFRPDLVLLDIGMPTLDGYAVARRIHSLALPPRPYIAAVTGYGTRDDRFRTGEAGFDLHLLKPVDPDTYRGLAALLQTSSGIVDWARTLAAQHRETATQLMFLQLEMANTYLNSIAVAKVEDHEENRIALAAQAHERLITWLGAGACTDERAVEFVSGLRGLNERLRLARRPYAGIDKRKVQRV
jgi:CheY-like chemotaxis protein